MVISAAVVREWLGAVAEEEAGAEDVARAGVLLGAWLGKGSREGKTLAETQRKNRKRE